ncbi:MAG: TlpA disulfide reductase family protein [Bacteroidales bacterium]
MKKNTIWTIILAFAVVSCTMNTPGNYTLTGTIAGQQQGMVYLQERLHGLYVNIDSTTIENGSFSMQGSMDHPKMVYLNVPSVNQRLMLFAENTEMDVVVDPQSAGGFQVSGSASHEIFREFNLLVATHDATLKKIQDQILEAEVLEQPELVEQLKADYQLEQEQKTKAIHDFVATHHDKTVGVYIAMRNLANSMNGEQLTQLVNSFDASLSETSYVITLGERAAKLRSVAIGQTAPDFTLPATDGIERSLSDFRGQYVLVSFWASWCSYCRAENPHLVTLYDQYKDQNFEILGVSLDRNHDAWLKGIADDGIQWPQISDLKGWQNEASSMYAVSSIPANVLVDPQGIIIARNLRGDDLDKKLEEVLNLPV